MTKPPPLPPPVSRRPPPPPLPRPPSFDPTFLIIGGMAVLLFIVGASALYVLNRSRKATAGFESLPAEKPETKRPATKRPQPRRETPQEDVEPLTGDFPELDVFAPRVGAIGKLPNYVTFTVAQIETENQMHVIPSEQRSRLIFNGLKQSQHFFEYSGNRLLFRGVPTSGLADSSQFQSPLVFKVSGTHAYVNVTGARATIFVLEPATRPKR